MFVLSFNVDMEANTYTMNPQTFDVRHTRTNKITYTQTYDKTRTHRQFVKSSFCLTRFYLAVARDEPRQERGSLSAKSAFNASSDVYLLDARRRSL